MGVFHVIRELLVIYQIDPIYVGLDRFRSMETFKLGGNEIFHQNHTEMNFTVFSICNIGSYNMAVTINVVRFTTRLNSLNVDAINVSSLRV